MGRTAAELEDWLRAKGKFLGYSSEVLANGLRAQFPSLPVQAVANVYGYITPVAVEYVRRCVYREKELPDYEKAQLYLFTLRAYSHVIDRYRGHLPNPEICIPEIMNTSLPTLQTSFALRMKRVTSIFDAYFQPESRAGGFDDDMIFTTAFMHQVVRIVKEAAGVSIHLGEDQCTRLLHSFSDTGNAVHLLLLDYQSEVPGGRSAVSTATCPHCGGAMMGGGCWSCGRG